LILDFKSPFSKELEIFLIGRFWDIGRLRCSLSSSINFGNKDRPAGIAAQEQNFPFLSVFSLPEG
jgi:hypothetical protein